MYIAKCIPTPYRLDEIEAMHPKGIIFTGGPNSVYGADSPQCAKEIFTLGIPILGICYGSQLIAHTVGRDSGNSASQRIREDRSQR